MSSPKVRAITRTLLFLCAFILAACNPASSKDGGAYGKNPANLDSWLDRLVAAYPETLKGYDTDVLVMRGGVPLALSDGNDSKTFDDMLNTPDIGDMFSQEYPAGAPLTAPAVDFDPGRVRVEALFKVLYGDCARDEVEAKIRRIAWVPKHGGGTVSITTAHGADLALEAVSRDLDMLPPSFGKYLVPSAGTYNCRPIAGTKRMSMHGYAAAIDLSTALSTYWRWVKPAADGTYIWSNQMPKEIVDIFEKYGFIWGGRWYHFDTMHFEYRPELLHHRQ